MQSLGWGGGTPLPSPPPLTRINSHYTLIVPLCSSVCCRLRVHFYHVLSSVIVVLSFFFVCLLVGKDNCPCT